jgi:putative ATPase
MPPSALFSGVADLKRIFAEAEGALSLHGRADAALRGRDPPLQPRPAGRLPALCRKGTVTLVGATTENPSFELNAALLSRAQVLILHRLDAAALTTLMERAEDAEGVPSPSPNPRAKP